MTIKDIQAYNQSPHACRIIAVLEVAASDPQVALKILISNPQGKDDCTLESFEELMKSNKVPGIRKSFAAILKALLDVRVRLPPIFWIHPRLILLDPTSHDCKIIVSQELFQRCPPQPVDNFELENIKYKSPEELFKDKRELTTPFWVLGCMMYEAHFNTCAWKTHLNPQVSLELIKKFPPSYPKSMFIKFRAELNDCIENLLEKDPSVRLGSDESEPEILEHAFFLDEDED